MDAARTAVRLGAAQVTVVYRRAREQMPANPWEVDEAEEEGVALPLPRRAGEPARAMCCVEV